MMKSTAPAGCNPKYFKECTIMKKTVAILLAVLAATMFVSCTNDGNDISDVQSQAESKVESSEPAESSAEEISEPAALDYVENIADYTVEADENGELMITKYNGSDPYIIIPAEYDGKPITTVYCTALLDCDFIKGIRVSEGIIEVDRDEYTLESEQIVEYGFCGCTSYEELTLPSTLKSLGTLMHSKNLRELVIPDGVTALELYAIAGCDALEKVVMSKNITSVPADCFASCGNLTEIVLPEKLEGIAKAAFAGTAITEFHLPDTTELVYGSPFPTGAKVYISKALSEKEGFLDMLKDECPDIEIIIE